MYILLILLILWLMLVDVDVVGFVVRLCVVYKRKNVLSDKDPLDWTKTNNSTSWHVDDQYCGHCKASTATREFMAGVCNNCGSQDNQRRYRPYRKIIQNGKWVYQYKYGNDKFELSDIKL